MPVTVPDRFHNVTLAGNTAGVLAEVSSGTLALAGGNNITLSQVGNAVTISGAAAAGAQTAISGLANSETTYTSGSVTLSGLANITIRSTTGQQFQFSVAAQTSQSNTLGMSNIGNTAGDTAIRSGPGLQIVFAGGNNVTLSQSTAGSSATITISAANETQTVPPVATTVQSVATANSVGTVTRFAPEDHRHVGIAQAQISGNTSNTSNVVLGSLVLAGGNNITLSQVSAAGAATITISAANETQTVPPIATAGKQVASARSTGTITRFAPEDHAHEGVAQFQISGNTSNTSNIVLGSLVLAGGNNITLSQVTAAGAATITISAPNLGAGAGYTAGMSDLGNTSGTTGVADSRLIIVGGNNITVSQSLDAANHSGTLTISAFNQTVESNTIGMSNIGNTSGDTAIRSAGQLQVVLAGGNGVTLSQSTNGSSATVTVSAGVATLDYWQMFPGITWATIAQGQSTVFIQPLLLPQAVTFDRVLHYISVSQSSSSNSSYSFSLDFHVGIYTKNASTLSLLKSGSAGYGWSVTSNNTTADQAGIRAVSVPVATMLVPGEYWVALLTIAKSTNANWATASNCVYPGGNSAYSGLLNVASNASFQPVLGMGLYSVQTAALPASIGFAQIQGANTAFFRSTPILNFANGTI